MADLTLVEGVACDHVGRRLLVFVDELGLGEPTREESHRGLDAFLRVDFVDVICDLGVVDEGHPRREALLHELVFFFYLRQVARIEELVLIRVVVCVALDLLQASSVRHHDNVEVA